MIFIFIFFLNGKKKGLKYIPPLTLFFFFFYKKINKKYKNKKNHLTFTSTLAMCSFLYFMVLFLFIALNRVIANTEDEMHIVPEIWTYSDMQDGNNYYVEWECRAKVNILEWNKRIKIYKPTDLEQKVFKFNDHLSYFTCVDKYCCFYENGQFYTNVKNYNRKTSEYQDIHTWSTMNYEEFKNQRITVKYNNNKKGSGFGELYVLSGLYSVKASTHCEGNDCTWSCEIDSKKEFQFQFPKPSTLTPDTLKTIKMYRGLNDTFSCSAGFCCNIYKKVNFNSNDFTDSNRYDWIKEMKSENYFTVPNFVKTCSEESPCTVNKPSNSNEKKSSHSSENSADNTVGSTSTDQDLQSRESSSLTDSTPKANLSETQTGGGNQQQPPHVSGSQTNGADNTVGSTSTNQGSKGGESSSLSESTAEAILSESQTGGGNQHPPPHVSSSQTNGADNTVGSTSTNQGSKGGESSPSNKPAVRNDQAKPQTGGGNQHPPPLVSGSQTIVPIMSLISFGIVFLC